MSPDRPLPGVPYAPTPSGAETLAAVIAARTTPGFRSPRVFRKPEEIGRAITETQRQVATEVVHDVTGYRYKRGPGKGRKVCESCGETSGAASKRCHRCRAPFA